MKLQINAKGSWRDVLAFDDAHVDAVRNTARELLTLARGQLSLRIATDQNSRLELCEGPDYTWKRSHTNLG